MTTATEAPTENKAKLAAREEARERLAEAQQKRATLDEKARAWAQDVAQAQAEYERLARTEQEQFDNAGQPKPKTAAAKLKPKIDDAKTSLPAMVAGADDRIAEREAEVRLIGKVNAITGGSWSICSTAAVLRSGRPTSDSSGRCIRRPRRRATSEREAHPRRCRPWRSAWHRV